MTTRKMRTMMNNNLYPYRVLDIYGYTMAYCKSEKEAIAVCNKEPKGMSVITENNTIYTK